MNKEEIANMFDKITTELLENYINSKNEIDKLVMENAIIANQLFNAQYFPGNAREAKKLNWKIQELGKI